jgi:hypothetical protein
MNEPTETKPPADLQALVRERLREHRPALRKIRTLPRAIKAVLYPGNKAGPAMSSQLNTDIQLYGLWEALLYVASYEERGQYVAGTTERACVATLQLLTEGAPEHAED